MTILRIIIWWCKDFSYVIEWCHDYVMPMTHLESILLTTNLRSVKIKNEFDGRQISRLLIDIKGITQQINPRASSTSSENRKIPITWQALKFWLVTLARLPSQRLNFSRSLSGGLGSWRSSEVMKNHLCWSIFRLLSGSLSFFPLAFES